MSGLMKEAIDIIIKEYRKEENKAKIEKNILDPIVNYIGHQLWPYILTVSIMLFVLFLLVFYLVYKTSYVSSTLLSTSLSSMNA
jgi:hypothetical protein